MTTIREQWNALLGRLGLASDTETAAGQTVTATRTLPHEDPSPTETPRSANQAAYDSDLRNFRR